MQSIPQKPPTGNALLRLPKTVRSLPTVTLVHLLTIALDHGVHVAGARVDDLRAELRRRECEAVGSW